MPWLCQCELRQTTIGLIVNKFGDHAKKIQCHAINTLVKVVSQAKRNMDNETHRIVLSEVLLFLQRPSTRPSQRIYCLGFLNKFAALTAGDDANVRNGLLELYFGLFNKLLHQNEVKVDPIEAMKKLKKDRTISKKDRIKQIKKLTKRKGSELDEEDNKVIELVLRGINVIIIKTSDTKDL